MIGYIVRICLTMLWLAVAVFLLLTLISFTPNDPSWSHVSSVNTGEVSNLAGMAGAWVADILYTVFGAASWLFIAIAGYEAWALWREKLGLPIFDAGRVGLCDVIGKKLAIIWRDWAINWLGIKWLV